MEIVIKRAVAQLIGYKSFAPFGISPEEWDTWRDKHTIDLGGLSSSKLDDLEALFERVYIFYAGRVSCKALVVN